MAGLHDLDRESRVLRRPDADDDGVEVRLGEHAAVIAEDGLAPEAPGVVASQLDIEVTDRGESHRQRMEARVDAGTGEIAGADDPQPQISLLMRGRLDGHWYTVLSLPREMRRKPCKPPSHAHRNS